MPRPTRKKNRTRKTNRGLKVFLFLFGLAFLALLLIAGVTQINNALNQAKSVVVGSDLEIGSYGDGPGQFKEPQCVAVDSADNFYVSDFSAHRIQKFDPNGTLLLTIGQEGKEEGQFQQPSGLFVDVQGDVYVCDTFNHRIQKFDPEGKVLKVWSHSFFGPRSIVGNGQGRLYVSDTGNHKIQVFDMEGNFLQEWGGMGTTNGKFREPVGITADPQGNLYVADSDNERIQKFDANGKFLGAFKVNSWKGKNDEVPYLAFGHGFLYASNSSQNSVLKFDPSGKLVSIFRRNNKEAKLDKDGFNRAAGVAIDSQDRVYVVEKGFNKVARFKAPQAPPK